MSSLPKDLFILYHSQAALALGAESGLQAIEVLGDFLTHLLHDKTPFIDKSDLALLMFEKIFIKTLKDVPKIERGDVFFSFMHDVVFLSENLNAIEEPLRAGLLRQFAQKSMDVFSENGRLFSINSTILLLSLRYAHSRNHVNTCIDLSRQFLTTTLNPSSSYSKEKESKNNDFFNTILVFQLLEAFSGFKTAFPDLFEPFAAKISFFREKAYGHVNNIFASWLSNYELGDDKALKKLTIILTNFNEANFSIAPEFYDIMKKMRAAVLHLNPDTKFVSSREGTRGNWEMYFSKAFKRDHLGLG